MSSQDSGLDSNSHITRENRKVLLFDLFVSGHHSAYIQHLVKYWCEHELQGILNVIVSPEFINLHDDVVNVAFECGQTNVKFIPISLEEEALIQSRKLPFNRVYCAFQEWHLLCKYVNLLKGTHCLIMYFDGLQLPLSWRTTFPCPLSGIYFRPVFHYSDFSEFTPSWRESFWQWRDKFFLSRILRHANFQTLFCLDPFVVNPIGQFSQQTKVVHLPDPVKSYSYSDDKLEKLRKQLGIHSTRKTFLMFGAFRKRKGIDQLLDAVELLPFNLCQKLCLLFVGKIGSEQQVQARIEHISKSLAVQIVNHDTFVPHQDVQSYFRVADVILAPYQRHIGMSGILLQAAATEKPVLSSNYGVMGKIVERYQLGLTVDSTSPVEIAKGLTQFLLEPPTQFCDLSSMRAFAEQNSAEKFAHTIFQHIF